MQLIHYQHSHRSLTLGGHFPFPFSALTPLTVECAAHQEKVQEAYLCITDSSPCRSKGGKPPGLLHQRAIHPGVGEHIAWRYMENRTGAEAICEIGNHS